jgi:hypothetical protein
MRLKGTYLLGIISVLMMHSSAFTQTNTELRRDAAGLFPRWWGNQSPMIHIPLLCRDPQEIDWTPLAL